MLGDLGHLVFHYCVSIRYGNTHGGYVEGIFRIEHALCSETTGQIKFVKRYEAKKIIPRVETLKALECNPILIESIGWCGGNAHAGSS